MWQRYRIKLRVIVKIYRWFKYFSSNLGAIRILKLELKGDERVNKDRTSIQHNIWTDRNGSEGFVSGRWSVKVRNLCRCQRETRIRGVRGSNNYSVGGRYEDWVERFILVFICHSIHYTTSLHVTRKLILSTRNWLYVEHYAEWKLHLSLWKLMMNSRHHSPQHRANGFLLRTWPRAD